MGATCLNKLDLALDLAASDPEALEAASKAIALACAPVKPEPRFDPIDLAGVPTIEVSTEWIEVAIRRGADESLPAVRAQLEAAHAWGPRRQVAVMFETSEGIRRVVLDGTAGAIAQAVPDRETLKSWVVAGALAFPVVLNPGPRPRFERENGDIVEGVRIEWLPLGQLPKVLQVEYASRSTYGSFEAEEADEAIADEEIDAPVEPSAKDVARAAVGQFDVRAELTAIAYKGVSL